MLSTPHELGAVLKERRRALGMSQVELARAIGASRAWIVDLEHGKPRLEVGLVLRAIRALGLELRLADASPAPSGPRLGVVPIDIDAALDDIRRKP